MLAGYRAASGDVFTLPPLLSFGGAKVGGAGGGGGLLAAMEAEHVRPLPVTPADRISNTMDDYCLKIANITSGFWT